MSETICLSPTAVFPFMKKRKRQRRAVSRTTSDRRLREFCETAEPDRQYTLEEIGKVMGVTRERVRQIEAKALRRLRFRLVKLLKADGVDAEEFKR